MTCAELEKFLNTQLQAFKLQLHATKELEKLAKDAVKAGDAKDLADAQGKNGAQRPSKLPTLPDIRAKFNEATSALQKAVAELAAVDKEIADIKAGILKLKMP